MTKCLYCDPDKPANRKMVVDNDDVMICVIGHTPIMNRVKKGEVQIYFKRTKEFISAGLDKCPICGKPLYDEA